MALDEHMAHEREKAAGAAPASDDVMLIGEVAVAIGLDPKTIRFYERAKLLQPRKHGRIRIYRGRDIARLQGIKKLRQYGISLAAMRSIIKTEGDLTLETVKSPNVQKFLASHLDEMNKRHQFIQEQIADLRNRLEDVKAAVE